MCGFLDTLEENEYDTYKYIEFPSKELLDYEMNFPVLSFPIRESYVSMRPEEYIKIGTILDESTNYSNDMNDFQYVMASFQDIETTINFSGKVKFNCIFDNCTDKKTTESGDKIIGPFWAIIEKGSTCEFITKLRDKLKEGYNDIFHSYIRKNHNDQFLSNKYGLLRYFNAKNTKHKYNINSGNYEAIKINAYNYVYINAYRNWRGEIIEPSLPLEDREFGPHLNKRSFYISGETECTFILYIDGDMNLFLISQSLEIENSYHCDKLLVFNVNPTSFSVKTKSDSDSIQLSENETLCIDANYKYPSLTYYINDCENKCDNVSIQLMSVSGYSSYKNPINYKNDTVEINLYGILAIKSNNENIDVDFDFNIYGISLDIEPFHHLTNKDWTGNYKFYSETVLDDSYGVHYIENKLIEREPEPEYFEGDTFEIKEESGFKFVNMNDLESLTIVCPRYSLLYIHNIDDIEVECYSDDGTIFYNINNTSLDRIVSFGEGGKAIVRKTSPNVVLFFSYMAKMEDLYEMYICSDPDFSLVFDKNTNFTGSNKDFLYFWFTYPDNVNLHYTKYLPARRHIYIEEYDDIYIEEKESNYHGKHFRITVLFDDSIPEFLYDKIIISPINSFLQSNNNTKYDVVSKYIDIPHINSAVKTKPESAYLSPTPTPEEKKDDDNLGIIVVVICCVGGVLVIAGIVTAVICVKKRKKNQQASSGEDEVDEKNEEV